MELRVRAAGRGHGTVSFVAIFPLLVIVTLMLLSLYVSAEDPTQYYEWHVSYGQLSPLGVPEQVILINDQFPGPDLQTTTNNVVSVNIFNNLDEPFLITWNGIQQRHDAWQDGTLGTNCPILPGQNWTYVIQFKDQIGSFFYYPSTLFQKAAGGYGGITIAPRLLDPAVKVPFDPPVDEFTVLLGDWYNTSHKNLREMLDSGISLAEPDGVLINGQGPSNPAIFGVAPGSTYRFRISNVGIATTLNFRIQGHQMLLVETEGSYAKQALFDSLDIHVGQSYSVMVTVSWGSASDLYAVASSRFTNSNLTGVAILHLMNVSTSPPSGPYPPGPGNWDFAAAFNQTNSIRQNTTTGAARPNPQGSFHYGEVNVSRTIWLENTEGAQGTIRRYAVNGWSFVQPETPLTLADYFNIAGVFDLGGLPDSFQDQGSPLSYGAAIIDARYKQNMTELIFQNNEPSLQVWHLDGYSFFVIGMQFGTWTPASRASYNLIDAISRSTVEVYPSSWTAVIVLTDNKGMWNLRSQHLYRQYLGQETYIRVYGDSNSAFEDPIPSNVILCGKAQNYTV